MDEGKGRHRSAFRAAALINAVFLVFEAAVGWRIGSVGLLADAGQSLSDVLGLLFAWAASRLAEQAPTVRRTYGFRRSTIIAALLNAIMLLGTVAGIGGEAIERLRHPAPLPTSVVMLVAAAGILVNGSTVLFFLSGRKRDLNVRGAFLRVGSDAGVSAAVFAAGLLIHLTGWTWLDPAISLVVLVLIGGATWGLLRESLDLALDAVPQWIDPDALQGFLAALPGVVDVHEVHIWALSTEEAALTAHLVVSSGANTPALLQQAHAGLLERFSISQATLQVEDEEHPLPSCPINRGSRPARFRET